MDRFGKIGVVAIGLFLSGAPGLSEEIHQVPDLGAKLQSVKTLAIAPIEPCPGVLDCEQIEKSLSSAVYELKLKSPWKPIVFSAKKVEQQLFKSGQKALPSGADELVKLATDLGVEGFLIPRVPHLGFQRKARTVVSAEDEATEARVELELFLVTSDPHVVFRGEDQGQDTRWSTPASYVSGLLKQILAKVFPKV